jgi:hypothetical protein
METPVNGITVRTTSSELGNTKVASGEAD